MEEAPAKVEAENTEAPIDEVKADNKLADDDSKKTEEEGEKSSEDKKAD